jgi:macrophage erythroblast attacher
MIADCDREPSTPPTEETDRTLDRYLVDYLLRTGRMRAARALAEKQGIEVSGLSAKLVC